MKSGNVNEIAKGMIFDWFKYAELASGSSEVESKALLKEFNFWMKRQSSDLPEIGLKLFTQTIARLLPFKRKANGTVFFIKNDGATL